jgi:transcriptional/translational regulatory protein YebC/TACO1
MIQKPEIENTAKSEMPKKEISREIRSSHGEKKKSP